MPEKKRLALPRDLIYLYDGTLPGFYCCVFESVYKKILPAEISPEDTAEASFLSQTFIDTDPKKARKVRDSIPEKISPRALELVETVYYSCLPQKEIAMLRFLLKGYVEGAKIVRMLGDPEVDSLIKAERHLLREAQLLRGFVRFSDYGGALAGVISPKNFVLPFIAHHFVTRYSDENFMIYDKIHRSALIYENKKARILSLTSMDFFAPSEEEERYRTLWKEFYKTISIKERENPRCRMGHMPKRYWENMTEMKELL